MTSQTSALTPPATAWDRLTLAAAFLTAFALVWFGLDHIGMDATEALHVVASRTPLSYLLRWSSTVEVHPPTFYLLLKGLYAFFQSEFGVKSFLAASFFGTLAALYRIGLLHDRRTALAALCLAAVNPIFLQAARSLRPHMLVFCFMSASLLFCLRYTRDNRPRDLACMAVANILGFSLHYMFAVYMLTQSALLVLLPRQIPLTRRVLVAGLTAAASFAPIAPFYLNTVRGGANMVLSKESLLRVVEATGEAYREVAASVFGGLFGAGPLLTAAAGLVLAGALWYAARLALRRDRLAAGLLLLLVTPAVFLVGTRHGFVMYKYIPQALIACILLVGLAASRLPKAAAPLFHLAVLGLGAACATAQDNSLVDYRLVSPFKALAPALAQAIGPRTFPSFTDDGSLEAYNLYYAPLVADNRILDRRIGPDQASVEHMLVGGVFFQQNLADFIAVNGEPDRSLDLSPPVRLWTIPRTPVTRIEALPARIRQTMAPRDFLSRVHSLRDVMFYSDFGDAVSPTRTGREGVCDFVYEMAPGLAPRFVGLRMDYDNLGEQDTLLVRVQFDEEPETLVFGSAGPSAWDRSFVALDRDRPFARLRVSVAMTTPPVTPKYPNWNRGLTRLKGLEVAVSAADEPGNLYPETINRLRMDTPHTGDLNRLIPLVPAEVRLEGLRQTREDGVGLYVPDAGGTGRATLTLNGVPGSLVVFARASGSGHVAVFEEGEGQRREVFRLSGVEGIWSPKLAGYAFLVPPSAAARRTFVLEADGPGAQLWLPQDALLFAMRPKK